MRSRGGSGGGGRTVVCGVGLNVFGEPLRKLIPIVKQRRHDKVEERPELAHVVLNWGSSQQKSVTTLIQREEGAPAGRGSKG